MTADTAPLVSRRALLAGAAAAGAGMIAAPLAAVASLFADEPTRDTVTASDTALADIPAQLLGVYAAAAAAQCPGLPWTVLAAIGAIESGHDPTAIGPPLDGSAGVAAIPATPQGTAWHGDARWERAVGLMQFLPATFGAYGVATTGSPPDPFHPADAAHSAAAYLCANGAGDPSRLRDALYAYNRAHWYVDRVLAQAAAYSAAAPTAPTGAGAVEPDYVAVALAQLGKPYRWGAAGPDAFDCSGLTSWSLAQVGVAIPRVSAAQAGYVAAYGHAVSPEAAAGVYGALVFRVGVGAINHVVISLGDGRTVEARRTGEPVQLNQLAGRRWTSAGLVPGLTYRAAAHRTETSRLAPAALTVAGASAQSPTFARSPIRTHPGTHAGTDAQSPSRPRPATPAAPAHPGQTPRPRAADAAGPRRHLSSSPSTDPTARSDRRGPGDSPQARCGAEAENEKPSAEGAPLQACPNRHSVRGDATSSLTLAPIAAWGTPAVGTAADERTGQLTELTAEIADALSDVPTLQTIGRAGLVIAVLLVGLVVLRHLVTRRALQPDRRIRLSVLPTETFDPSDEEVARYAAQLSRTRRTVRGPGRPAQAVRLRLDSTGDGQCIYRLEGAAHAASILKLSGYHETELRPTDAAEPDLTSVGHPPPPTAPPPTAPPADSQPSSTADSDHSANATSRELEHGRAPRHREPEP